MISLFLCRKVNIFKFQATILDFVCLIIKIHNYSVNHKQNIS